MRPRAAAQVDELAALQAALAGEHAAVWACGRVAAELSGPARVRALDDLDAHRAGRDALRLRIRATGAEPVGAAPAYVEPFPVTSTGSARRLLAHVENALSACYADVAAAGSPGKRAVDVTASVTAARRSVAWGGPSTAFPGAAT